MWRSSQTVTWSVFCTVSIITQLSQSALPNMLFKISVSYFVLNTFSVWSDDLTFVGFCAFSFHSWAFSILGFCVSDWLSLIAEFVFIVCFVSLFMWLSRTMIAHANVQDRLLKPLGGYLGYNMEWRELAQVISRVLFFPLWNSLFFFCFLFWVDILILF